ncbi:MAG: Ni/Fe-hydrogenase cytochrome b subunit [Ignavibacteriales bacterium]|nr:Ni/Fe-hydrogenase cytochrome b subunit [Ignavibacteriales bacterium]
MKKVFTTFGFWKIVAVVLLTAGLYSTYVRFFEGLGASTNLSDQFPWGIWIGFDVLCGVGLAAGGFTLAAIVYIFNIKRFEPIIRPTILTAFLGYVLVVVGLMFDLGRPLQIWHAIIMWNPRSVMFEVAWCVMLYNTVLALEFAPVILEKFKLTRTIKIIKRISIPLIILGVLLSTLHQSSLGSLYLIVPEKMYPLWYSAYMPLFFYVSAIAAGCAMIIFESFLSSRAFKRGLEIHLLQDIARVCVVMLGVYATMKFVDLSDRKILPLLLEPRFETYMYWLEAIVGVIVPFILLAQAKVRSNPTGLFVSAIMVVCGFIMNRMNVAITGMEGWSGVGYFPSLTEFSITMMIVTIGFIAFYFIAKYFPVFTHEEHHEKEVAHAAVAWKRDIESVSQMVEVNN